MRVLVDSSVFVAAARASETHHARARAALDRHSADSLATPITILAETMSFLGARLGAEQQRRFWDAFMESGIETIDIDTELLQLARDIDRRYEDLAFGFADCTLLAACERERTAVVLSFDARLTAYRPTFAPAILLPG